VGKYFVPIIIPFNSSFKKIAVSLSGGADSALLAFLLCDQISQQQLYNVEVHIISHTRCWKTKPWQQWDSLKIYNWLTKKFPKIQFVRHTNFIAPDLEYGNTGPNLTDEYGKLVSGDNIQIRSYSEYVCHYNNLDAYYNGVTKNPENIEGMPSRNISANDSNKHLQEMTHMGKMVYHPFRFLNKGVIIKEYKNKNILDLLDITRSCEGTFENITYENYTAGQYVPICGTCFWCKEREWAIEQSK
jgi:7-cyano-7-deazaguanine synthase in queuosine biosynthesis